MFHNTFHNLINQRQLLITKLNSIRCDAINSWASRATCWWRKIVVSCRWSLYKIVSQTASERTGNNWGIVSLMFLRLFRRLLGQGWSSAVGLFIKISPTALTQPQPKSFHFCEITFMSIAVGYASWNAIFLFLLEWHHISLGPFRGRSHLTWFAIEKRVAEKWGKFPSLIEGLLTSGDESGWEVHCSAFSGAMNREAFAAEVVWECGGIAAYRASDFRQPQTFSFALACMSRCGLPLCISLSWQITSDTSFLATNRLCKALHDRRRSLTRCVQRLWLECLTRQSKAILNSISWRNCVNNEKKKLARS